MSGGQDQGRTHEQDRGCLLVLEPVMGSKSIFATIS